MAIPAQLLEQLLPLDEPARLEIAHALLESVDAWVDHGMSEEERTTLDASIERSLAQSDAGQGVPIEQAIAAIRARRARRSSAAR